MSYYSGTASSITALRTALLTHAQADGWALSGDVLSKAGVFFRIDETATNIRCLGCEDNALANPAPGVVMIGRIYFVAGQPTREITFPCNYEVFGFGQEIYLIINYDTDRYQWMAFGKSTVPGLPGQGGWCGATTGGAWAESSMHPFGLQIHGPTTISTGVSWQFCGAVMFPTNSSYGAGPLPGQNSWCNSGLDGRGWFSDMSHDNYFGFAGLYSISELLWQQPNGWNTEAALLPVRAWKHRLSFKISLIADLEHARNLRIDNLAPGDILTLGADRWKVFPWYRKNAAQRNGGNDVDHTGTFGWAIRYEGP